MVMTESEARAAIVAEARRWIATPYHNCADVRGAGIDCGMLLVRVFVDLGLMPPVDPRPYASDWHLHRGEERYLGHLQKHFVEANTPDAGDVIVFRYGRCYSHGGIVTLAQPLTLVHAYWPTRMVLEEELSRNAELADPARERRFFSIWPKAAA